MAKSKDLPAQNLLLTRLKSIVGGKRNLANDFTKILRINSDSAYRRIRLETVMSFEEIALLARHYNLPIDPIIGQNNGSKFVSFNYLGSDDSLKEYLNFHAKVYQQAKEANIVNFYSSCRDFSLSYLVYFPELWYFKGYFFTKVVWNMGIMKDKDFSSNSMEQLLASQGININNFEHLKESTRYNSKEIWNYDTFKGHLNQIRYCWNLGYFENKELALKLCDQTLELAKHIRKQAETGRKFRYGNYDQPLGNYEIYLNDAITLEYFVLRELDGDKMIFHNSNLGEYLATSDIHYCDRMLDYFNMLILKSSPISVANELSRNRLFNTIYKQIADLRTEIENS